MYVHYNSYIHTYDTEDFLTYLSIKITVGTVTPQNLFVMITNKLTIPSSAIVNVQEVTRPQLDCNINIINL